MAVLRMEAGREHVFHELIHPEMSTSDRFLCTLLESIRARTYLDPNNPNPNYTVLFVYWRHLKLAGGIRPENLKLTFNISYFST